MYGGYGGYNNLWGGWGLGRRAYGYGTIPSYRLAAPYGGFGYGGGFLSRLFYGY